MRRWLDMIASGQPARRVALDAGIHALAGLVDWLPDMKERMAACELIEDVEYARHGDMALQLDIVKPKGPGPHPARRVGAWRRVPPPRPPARAPAQSVPVAAPAALAPAAASGARGAMPKAVTAKQLSRPTTEAVSARGWRAAKALSMRHANWPHDAHTHRE